MRVELKVKVNGSWRYAGDMDVSTVTNSPLARRAVENTMESRMSTMKGTEARAIRPDGSLYAIA